jgi:hypothetical protein
MGRVDEQMHAARRDRTADDFPSLPRVGKVDEQLRRDRRVRLLIKRQGRGERISLGDLLRVCPFQTLLMTSWPR